MSCVCKLCNFLLEYETVKYVKVKNKKVGIVYRLLQLSVLAYLIVYVLVLQRGYQQFSDVEGFVKIKVKGVVSTNFSDEEFVEEVQNPSVYRRVWDNVDLIIPPSENNEFFIATNVVITPNQTLSTCAESPETEKALCSPGDNTCIPGKPFYLGGGVATGKCIRFPDNLSNTYTCEVEGWCPLEVDKGPLKPINGHRRGLLSNTQNFTVLIKNFVYFPLNQKTSKNFPDTENLSNCRYNEKTHPHCPIFLFEDIVKKAGYEYNEIAPVGGVIGIIIDWNCNLDSSEQCFPTYSFRGLTKPEATVAPGWNFRYANYFSDETRTLYKVYGISFVVILCGSAGSFHIIPLLVKIGATLALLTGVSVICDLCILYIVKKRGNNNMSSLNVNEDSTEYEPLTDSLPVQQNGSVVTAIRSFLTSSLDSQVSNLNEGNVTASQTMDSQNSEITEALLHNGTDTASHSRSEH